MLSSAADSGNVDMLSCLISHGLDVDAKAGLRAEPVHAAARSGHVAMIRALHSHGASIDIRSSDGVHPLRLAAQKGHIEVAKTLLEIRADLDLPLGHQDAIGQSILFPAAGGGHVDWPPNSNLQIL